MNDTSLETGKHAGRTRSTYHSPRCRARPSACDHLKETGTLSTSLGRPRRPGRYRFGRSELGRPLHSWILRALVGLRDHDALMLSNTSAVSGIAPSRINGFALGLNGRRMFSSVIASRYGRAAGRRRGWKHRQVGHERTRLRRRKRLGYRGGARGAIPRRQSGHRGRCKAQ
ncbi:hypothetical protein BKA93DRAFT_219138 [Sparassis latifolia]